MMLADLWKWAGQTGQPAWVWGANAQNDYRLWNPANFNVKSAKTADSAGYANSAGYATGAGYANSAGSAGSAGSVPWSGVTGKPATMPPSAHNQGAATITTGTFPQPVTANGAASAAAGVNLQNAHIPNLGGYGVTFIIYWT